MKPPDDANLNNLIGDKMIFKMGGDFLYLLTHIVVIEKKKKSPKWKIVN